jgi:hypothetical protein
MNNTTMTKERYLQIIATFKSFVKNKKNHPTIDQDYGTKYEGNVRFEHFVLYAMLRNREPAKTTHDVNCETYISVMEQLKRMANSSVELSKHWSWGWSHLNKGFGLTEEEFRAIVNGQ